MMVTRKSRRLLARLQVTVLLTALFASQHALSKETKAIPVEEQVSKAAVDLRLRLDFDGRIFSGPAWDQLVNVGKTAQFFLIGEEHGIAENPKLVAQLFSTLTSHGYSKFAIETSPTMASLLDDALAKDGLNGLRRLFAQPGGEPAFFGMTEEAQMLADVRAAAAPDNPVFWGTDYEVASDRQLIALLERAGKPAAAEAALKELRDKSAASWKSYEQTGDPGFIFSFAGDPQLVRSLQATWPEPDLQSKIIMNTLEKTLLINQLWINGERWASNKARADLQRENFLRYWRTEQRKGATPRLIAKYGASHMVRGLSQTDVYDLGTLLPEIAELDGGFSTSLLIVPGRKSLVAGLNASKWTYEPRKPYGGYMNGIDPLLELAFEDTYTLIDLVPLRSILGMARPTPHKELSRIIHGFDMLLVMSGSTPAGELQH